MLTTTEKVHFTVGRSAQKIMKSGESQMKIMPVHDRIPRITRWMALAMQLQLRIEKGELRNQSAIARAGDVTRARLSQLMSLNHLAPDLQESLLFLPRVIHGADPIQMRHVIPVTKVSDWNKQRTMWQRLRSSQTPPF